jgi:hypothetical protein
VAQFIRNGFLAHDNKSDRLKTEASQRLWIRRSWKHSNTLKNAAVKKATISNGNQISSDARQNTVTMKATVPIPVNSTAAVYPEPQRGIITSIATALEVAPLRKSLLVPVL